jgi:hypothetical protein
MPDAGEIAGVMDREIAERNTGNAAQPESARGAVIFEVIAY